MKISKLSLSIVICVVTVFPAFSEISTNYINLFKGVTPQKGDFEVVFNHRFFSPIANSTAADWYGLDSGAQIGYGVNYGITQKLAVGIYRTTLLKTYNASIMYNIFDDKQEWPTATQNPSAEEWTDKTTQPPKDFFTLGAKASYSWISLIEVPGNYSVNGELTLSKQFWRRFSISTSLMYVSKATGMDTNTAFWRSNDLGVGFAAEVLIWGNLFALGEFNMPFTIWSNRFPTKSFGLSYQTYGHDFKLFLTNSTATTLEAITFSQVSNVRIGFSITRIL